VTVRTVLLNTTNAELLARVAPGVFDHPVDARWSAEFIADPRHHLAVAVHDGAVIGMASAVHYVHPDKPPELWINEVGVSPDFRGRGVGRDLLACLFGHARTLGCRGAWVLAERSNAAAVRLYAAAGGTEAAPPVMMFTFDLSSE